HLYWRAAYKHNHGSRIQACDPRNELVLALVKRHIPAIRPFKVILMSQSAEEKNGISQFDRLNEPPLVFPLPPVPWRDPAHLDPYGRVTGPQFNSKFINPPTLQLD